MALAQAAGRPQIRAIFPTTRPKILTSFPSVSSNGVYKRLRGVNLMRPGH
jgi:hypothetical protein